MIKSKIQFAPGTTNHHDRDAMIAAINAMEGWTAVRSQNSYMTYDVTYNKEHTRTDVLVLVGNLNIPMLHRNIIIRACNRQHDLADHSWHEIYHSAAVAFSVPRKGDVNEAPAVLTSYLMGVYDTLGDNYEC